MDTQKSLFQKQKTQSGNATIYVLIVVALFAALAFTVSRQNDSSESSGLSAERADILAAQILAYPYQVKQAIDMMGMTGADMSDLDFTQPGQTDFETDPYTDKVYHPGGGGLNPATLPKDAVAQSSDDPAAGWYLGMFNNFLWSQSAENDVMLVAYQLRREVCERINMKITGKPDIPILSSSIPAALIDKDNPPGITVHTANNALVFDLTTCADCEEKPSMCVGDTSGTRYGFYTLIINR